MGASAFVLGFFVALGGWTATKLTNRVDNIINPPKVEKNIDVKIENTENKEKENDRGN
jgi:hypothetical protein